MSNTVNKKQELLGQGDGRMQRPLVMVVDDQPGVRRLLYEAFVDDGYDVELASGGNEALRKLETLCPEVILLDLRMPGLSGLDTLKAIQEKNGAGSTLNVVIMTAYGEMDLIHQARKMGVEWCVKKPFDLGELRCLVKAVIAGVPAEKTAEREQVATN